MAILFDASNSTQGTNVTNLTTPAWTCAGSDRFLLAAMTWGASAAQAYSEMRWGGAGGTLLTQVGTSLSDGWNHTAVARLIAPATGSNTLYGAVNSQVDQMAIGGATWTGVHQTTPLGSPVTNTGVSGTATVDISSASGEVVVDAVATDANVSITKDASQTIIWEQEAIANDTSDGQSYEAGAATVTMSWALSESTGWVIMAVAIKPAAGAGVAGRLVNSAPVESLVGGGLVA